MSTEREPLVAVACAFVSDDGRVCGRTREWDGHNPVHASYQHSVTEHWPPKFSDMVGAFPFLRRA